MSDDLIKRLRRTPLYDGAGEDADSLADEAAVALEVTKGALELCQDELHKRVEDNRCMREALVRAERKLSAYVGVCNGDKELTGTILPMVRAALIPPSSGGSS